MLVNSPSVKRDSSLAPAVDGSGRAGSQVRAKRAAVRARPMSSCSMNRTKAKASRVQQADEKALNEESRARARPITGSSVRRGGFFMMSLSTGSMPRASAGRPSVTRLTHRIWIGKQRHGPAEQGSEEHRQDLAGVAGQEVMDELLDVVVDAPAFLDGGDDRGEVVVRDDHVRDFLGHVRPGDAHGHADIGFLDRRGVVDAVAGHGHDVSPRLPGPDDPQLVLGRNPGVDRRPLDSGRRRPHRRAGRAPRPSGPRIPDRRIPAPGRWPRPCSCGRR